MADSAGLNGGGSRRIIIALALLLGLGAGGWALRGILAPVPVAEAPEEAAADGPAAADGAAADAPATDAPVASETTDDATDTSEAVEVPATDEAADDGSEETAAVVEEEPEPTPDADVAGTETADDAPVEERQTEAPSFDVVRVDPDGSTVVAGRAAPGSDVNVVVDGETAGTAQADAAGGFVALLDLGRSDAPRAMSLETGDEDAESSDEVVVLAPSAAVEEPAEETETASAADDGPADAAEEQPAESAEVAGVAETQPAEVDEIAAPASEELPAPAEEADEPEAPSVILADESGVRVLQGGETSPEVTGNVVIDAITYDAEGEVALSGRAPSQSFVRVYIDNEPIEIGEVGVDGQWRTALPNVDTGVYTLRVDQVDAEGSVISRAETPFRREAAQEIRELAVSRLDEARPIVELITVQPGNTLWGISNNTYGDGVLYVRLFEANRDKILNPDLIYPGQIFAIPN